MTDSPKNADRAALARRLHARLEVAMQVYAASRPTLAAERRQVA